MTKWSNLCGRIGLFALVLLSGQWTPTQPGPHIQYLPLDAPPDVEFSSLAWVGDTLLFLPEKPERFIQAGTVGSFFSLPKQQILDVLDGRRTEPLVPTRIPLTGSMIQRTTDRWGMTAAGFEAMAVYGQTLYLLIEGQSPTTPTDMHSYLVRGTLAPDLNQIHLDLSAPLELPQQAHYYNLSYESLTVIDGKLVAMYEVNSRALNPGAHAVIIDPETGALSTLPVPAIGARVTDITPPDQDGVFEVLSCCLLGEALIAGDVDLIKKEYGLSVLTAPLDEVPRIIPLRYTDQGIVPAQQPIISVTWTDKTAGENWEGIARLDDRGFLIVTDEYPATLLGFVPVPSATTGP